MHVNFIYRSLLTSIVCGSLAACGGGGKTPNAAPTISLTNATVKERQQVNVVAAIQDSDGSIAKILWSQSAGVAVTLSDASNATLSFKAPDVSKDEKLTFSVSATDNQGAISTKDVTITVTNNQLPTLTATNATIKERKNVELKAQAADTDGLITSWVWKQKSGTAAVLNATTADTLSFTAPQVTKDETLVFEVQVTDDTGESVAKDVELVVVNNRTPAVEALNKTTKEKLPVQLQMTATDADGSIVNYSWTQKSGVPATLSNTTAAALNFSAPEVGQDEALVFTAKATDDDGESVSKDVVVTVINNKLPVISVSNASVRERGAVNIAPTITDPDGTIATYKWTQKSGVAATIADTSSPTLKFSAPDVSKDETLVFEVQATDDSGEASSKDVSVSVLNNKPPVIVMADFSVPEKMSVSIVPTVTDPDDAVVETKWTQKSGLSIATPTISGNSFNFIGPDVSKDETLVFTLTAKDAFGDVTSKDITVKLIANVEKLTINGLVTDGPIPNAAVKIQVGSYVKDVQADSSGNYSAELAVDEKEIDSLVKITATAAQPTYVKLVSQLGDFRTLLSAAGSDKKLTVDEVFAVNVTHVTTATHSLLQAANNNQPLTTKQSYETAMSNYDSSTLLDIATAIKLIADYQPPKAGMELPVGFTDTEAFALNPMMVAKYLAKAKASQAAIVDLARNSTVNDKNVVKPIVDPHDRRGLVYYVEKSSELASDSAIFTFGFPLGFFSNDVVSTDFDFILLNGALNIVYGPTFRLTGIQIKSEIVNINNVPVQEVTYLSSTSIKFVNNTDKSVTLLIKNSYLKKYPGTQLADVSVPGEYVSRKAYKEAAVVNAADVLQAGETYSLDMPTATDAFDTGHLNAKNYQRRNVEFKVVSASMAELSRVVFRGDGFMRTEITPAKYEILPSGLLLIKPEGAQYPSSISVRMWNKDAPVRVSVNAGNKSASGYLLKQQSSWTQAMVAGIYDFGVSYQQPMNYGWVEFNADGTALYVSTIDYNSDGNLTNDEFRLVRGLWRVENDGKLYIRRYRNAADFCTSLVWQTEINDSCIFNEERIWNLRQIVQDRYFVNLTSHSYFDFFARQSLRTVWINERNVLLEAASLNRSYQKVATRPIAIPQAVLDKFALQQDESPDELAEPTKQQQQEAGAEWRF